MLARRYHRRIEEEGQGATVDVVSPIASLSLGGAIGAARASLLSHQRADGHWVYELEADCTIPAEYILMNHFTGEINDELEQRIAIYLRQQQAEDGGWVLYAGGDFDLSCSVKAYFALKLVGDDPHADHMVQAREAILRHGGAAQSNVFTRITLALFAQVPWRATPFIPAEVILLPRWFPFHIDKVSYWSRTVMVPLFILCTLKPVAMNPRGVDIRELFTTPPEEEAHYFRVTTPLSRAFLLLDRLGRCIDKLVPSAVRRLSIRKCEQWFSKRMNGEHGLGGIFPAMVNAYESLVVLGYAADHPLRVQARTAIEHLLVERGPAVYYQPCVSPVWDTALACQSLLRSADNTCSPAVQKGLDWLRERQLRDEPGDWRRARPGLAGGGWAFQYSNYYYPDLDDTSMVGWAMCRADRVRYADAIARAAEWTAGMQSRNGGFGSFEVDNTHYYLNAIPFADHGALLDPPTADVTARCLLFLALVDREKYASHIDQALAYIQREQEADGSWFGRWGTNYIYGTWSVLTALAEVGEDPARDYIQRAIAWIKAAQHGDGGWGESNASYFQPPQRHRPHNSTPFQTAWALLALMAAGESHCEAVQRGVDFLLKQQALHGGWYDDSYTAPGFPRVFYLRYHGYNTYFPLWALSRYEELS